MSEQGQKIQLELAFHGACEGEARTAPRRGTESLMAARFCRSPASSPTIRPTLVECRRNPGCPRAPS
jgi:hypothetical protein